MEVAMKNIQKSIYKWPQKIPAKSNKGFGIDANIKIVKNEFFYT